MGNCVWGSKEITDDIPEIVEQELNDPKYVISDGTMIEDNVSIDENFFIGYNCAIRNNVRIGKNVVIGHLVTIEEDVIIGDNVRIQANCYITKGTVIHDDVFIGPGVFTFNDKYICSHGRPKKSQLVAPIIHRGARVGGGTSLLPEISIGQNSMIGAGSTVTRSIPPCEVWYGNPAIKRGFVPEEERV